MVLLKEFFNQDEESSQKGITQKNNLLKRQIIAHMVTHGESTLSELTRRLHISIPTMTKLVGELIEDQIVVDNGKIETSGGRRPNIFGLANTAIYFAGLDVCRDRLGFVITDLKNNVLDRREASDFRLIDTTECLSELLDRTEHFLADCSIDRNKILGLGVCISGRVNPRTGRSYKYFTTEPQSLRELIETRTGIRTLIENDMRARSYAEYYGRVRDAQHVIYLHLGKGVGIGIIIDGKLYYGKSGFAGEFGHTPFFDNEIICACGKKGCLETEVSGMAIERKMISKIEEGVNTILREQYDRTGSIHIDDIIKAAKHDDNLSIELIEEAGEKIGKSVAFLINIFNPELVIIGGNLAQAGDYLMLPMKSAVNKYSLSLVYNDTAFRLTSMGEESGALGAAMLIRNHIIGL